MSKKQPKIAKRLRKAFDKAATLSKEEQVAFASWLVDALEDRRWANDTSVPAEPVEAEPAARTVRDEILDCIRELTGKSRVKTFSAANVIDCMKARGSSYSEASIRTTINTKMIAKEGESGGDLERVGRGTYRLRK